MCAVEMGRWVRSELLELVKILDLELQRERDNVLVVFLEAQVISGL